MSKNSYNDQCDEERLKCSALEQRARGIVAVVEGAYAPWARINKPELEVSEEAHSQESVSSSDTIEAKE